MVLLRCEKVKMIGEETGGCGGFVGCFVLVPSAWWCASARRVREQLVASCLINLLKTKGKKSGSVVSKI